MIPAIFAVSIAQIGLLINTAYASFLPTGSISYIYYADRVMEFPVGVFGVAMSNILLNHLSKHALDSQKFSKLLDWGIKLCLIIGLPTSLIMGMLALPIVQTLFLRGNFNEYCAIMTAHALIGYSVGFIGLLLVKIFAPAFYARQDIKTPVKIAICVLIINQIINIILIPILGASGLTLAIGISACLNALALFILLIKKKIYQPKIKFKKLMLKILIAMIIMALSMKIYQWFIPYNFDHGFIKNILVLSTTAAIGLSTYTVTLFIYESLAKISAKARSKVGNKNE
jgi:putative peptidoglycan lipid II flippase